jgi:hypothetical protein
LKIGDQKKPLELAERHYLSYVICVSGIFLCVWLLIADFFPTTIAITYICGTSTAILIISLIIKIPERFDLFHKYLLTQS